MNKKMKKAPNNLIYTERAKFKTLNREFLHKVPYEQPAIANNVTPNNLNYFDIFSARLRRLDCTDQLQYTEHTNHTDTPKTEYTKHASTLNIELLHKFHLQEE